MTNYYLKAGTVVKHGTSSIHLNAILEEGIIPGKGRHQFRHITENAPHYPAVYVGGIAAYFGAYVSHSAVFKEYELSTPSFQDLINSLGTNQVDGLPYGDVPLSLPVVLNITLKEDTILVGDEDFIEGLEGQVSTSPQAQDCWNNWQSGGLIREGGIPPSWITHFEFPRPINRTDDLKLESAITKRMMLDSELMVAGVSLVNKKIHPTAFPWRDGKASANGRALSSQMAMSKENISKLFSFNTMRSPANRLYNLAYLTNFFQMIAEVHGVSWVK
jgi:hypothetical protein